MRPRLEKPPIAEAMKFPTEPEGRIVPEMSARMHFYAVHNAGDQLRWGRAPQSTKKPDRMVGR